MRIHEVPVASLCIHRLLPQLQQCVRHFVSARVGVIPFTPPPPATLVLVHVIILCDESAGTPPLIESCMDRSR
eukprot:scaffold79560_cov36-Tisochrysis_lutea.AAC.1